MRKSFEIDRKFVVPYALMWDNDVLKLDNIYSPNIFYQNIKYDPGSEYLYSFRGEKEVDKKLVEMPPPLSSPYKVRAGPDVNSIRRSWAQQTSDNLAFASEQELPPMISNTQLASSYNTQVSSMLKCTKLLL